MRNKQPDPKHRSDDPNNPIPAFEVRGFGRIVCCAPSYHKSGNQYRILGVETPKCLDFFELADFEAKLQQIINTYNLTPFGNSNNSNSKYIDDNNDGDGSSSSGSSSNSADTDSPNITLTEQQVNTTVRLLVPFYVKHIRNDFVFHFSGLACKEGININSAADIIKGIIKKSEL